MTAALLISVKILESTNVSRTGGKALEGVSSRIMVVLPRPDTLSAKIPLKTRLTCNDSERESTETIAVPPPGNLGPPMGAESDCTKATNINH